MTKSTKVTRTTVTVSDETHAVLAKWADRDVRTIANLIEAIVVSHLRGMPLDIPKDVQIVEKATATTRAR